MISSRKGGFLIKSLERIDSGFYIRKVRENMQAKYFDLPSGTYAPLVGVVDSLGSEVIQGVSPEFEIAMTGKYRGRTANLGYCLGRRSLGWSSTSVPGDVSNYLDTSQQSNTPVTVGTTYYIRSTSSEDSSSGTGVRTLRVNYLDSLGHRTITTITMNGTTAVSLGNDISFVQYIESDTVGSTGAAVGSITVSSVTGSPTVAQTIDRLAEGDNRSLSGRVKVPTGFDLYLRGWFISAISATMDCRLSANVFTDNRGVSPSFHPQQQSYLSSGQNIDFDFEFLKFPSGSELKVSAIPGSAPAGNRCDANFHFLLISKT